MTPWVPTFLDMWEAADVVIVCSLPHFEEVERDEDVSSPDPKLEYYRSELTFPLSSSRTHIFESVIKGELTVDEKDYLESDMAILFQARTAKKKEHPEEEKDIIIHFGYSPFISPPPEGSSRCLLFLERTLGGGLKPVHDDYFMYYLNRP